MEGHVSNRHRVQVVSSIGLAMLLTPIVAFAQTSPWERAAGNLANSFTGPLARSLPAGELVSTLIRETDASVAAMCSSTPAPTQ